MKLLALVAAASLAGCIQEPALFIDLTGRGVGRVTSEPPAIDCGHVCGMQVDYGVAPTLTATPRTGSIFVGWRGGGCAGVEPCTPQVFEDTTIEAEFEPEVQMLTVSESSPIP